MTTEILAVVAAIASLAAAVAVGRVHRVREPAPAATDTASPARHSGMLRRAWVLWLVCAGAWACLMAIENLTPRDSLFGDLTPGLENLTAVLEAAMRGSAAFLFFAAADRLVLPQINYRDIIWPPEDTPWHSVGVYVRCTALAVWGLLFAVVLHGFLAR